MGYSTRLLADGVRSDPGRLLDRLVANGAAGLHLGHETCCRLLPSPDFVRRTERLLAEEGLDLSLVTPAMVPEPELARIEALLAALPDGAEVVANDWGVLYAVATRHERLEPVLGRMLCAVRVDPRVPRIVRQAVGRAEADRLLADLRQPPVVSPLSLPLLSRLRVRRVELNPAAQGLPAPADDGLRYTLHQPWAIISASRYCPQQRLPPHREPLQVLSCTRECLQQQPLELRHRGFPAPLYLVDNAILARAEQGAIDHPQVDRVVIRPLEEA